MKNNNIEIEYFQKPEGTLITFTSSEYSSTCCGADITGGCGDEPTILCKSCYNSCDAEMVDVQLTQTIIEWGCDSTDTLWVRTNGGHILRGSEIPCG